VDLAQFIFWEQIFQGYQQRYLIWHFFFFQVFQDLLKKFFFTLSPLGNHVFWSSNTSSFYSFSVWLILFILFSLLTSSIFISLSCHWILLLFLVALDPTVLPGWPGQGYRCSGSESTHEKLADIARGTGKTWQWFLSWRLFVHFITLTQFSSKTFWKVTTSFSLASNFVERKFTFSVKRLP